MSSSPASTVSPGDSDDSGGPGITASRAAVEFVDRAGRASVATGPVLDDAAGFLQGMAAAAVGHGADLASYQGKEWFRRLAHTALEMAAARLAGTGARTDAQAEALLDAVAEQCAVRQLPARRVPYRVNVERMDQTPAWGRDGDSLLSIGVDTDTGCWTLAPTAPSMGGLMVTGACTREGIGPLLDLATAINTGQLPAFR